MSRRAAKHSKLTHDPSLTAEFDITAQEVNSKSRSATPGATLNMDSVSNDRQRINRDSMSVPIPTFCDPPPPLDDHSLAEDFELPRDVGLAPDGDSFLRPEDTGDADDSCAEVARRANEKARRYVSSVSFSEIMRWCIGVITLVAPGPEVTTTTPGLPDARA